MCKYREGGEQTLCNIFTAFQILSVFDERNNHFETLQLRGGKEGDLKIEWEKRQKELSLRSKTKSEINGRMEKESSWEGKLIFYTPNQKARKEGKRRFLVLSMINRQIKQTDKNFIFNTAPIFCLFLLRFTFSSFMKYSYLSCVYLSIHFYLTFRGKQRGEWWKGRWRSNILLMYRENIWVIHLLLSSKFPSIVTRRCEMKKRKDLSTISVVFNVRWFPIDFFKVHSIHWSETHFHSFPPPDSSLSIIFFHRFFPS